MKLFTPASIVQKFMLTAMLCKYVPRKLALGTITHGAQAQQPRGPREEA